jgi:hypothetical protein
MLHTLSSQNENLFRAKLDPKAGGQWKKKGKVHSQGLY